MPEPANEAYFESLAAAEGAQESPEDEPDSQDAPHPYGRIVPPPADPMAVARQFLAEHYTGEGEAQLVKRHRGSYHTHQGAYWREAEDSQIRAVSYEWLEDALYPTDHGYAPFQPNRSKVANMLEALQAITYLDGSVDPPAWLDDEARRPAPEIVAVRNGLLHVATRELQPHTPLFFNQHALSFDYDPGAATPRRWLRFLDQLWGDDQEAIDTLAEEMGYILGGGTGQQKMFMLVGPKRSGKGTIGRVLTGLLGAHNTAAPTLAGLTTNFGLQPLIGKPLAIISDARLGEQTNRSVAVERLLSISGEDSITVDRKYRDPWTGKLPSRFVILTNELPDFTDSSGALASRFILLTLNNSFLGKENPRLTEELLAEASGIFNWALDGLARLTERGYFIQPESAREALRHLEDMSSPIGAFVRDLCDVGPAYEVAKDDLFKAWELWCEEEGRPFYRTKAVFARDLRAAVPGLKVARLGRRGQPRKNVFRGLRLRPAGPVAAATPRHDTSAEPVSGRGPGHEHREADSPPNLFETPPAAPTPPRSDLPGTAQAVRDAHKAGATADEIAESFGMPLSRVQTFLTGETK